MCSLTERLSAAPLFTIGDVDIIFNMAREDLEALFYNNADNTFLQPALVLNIISRFMCGMIKNHADGLLVEPE